jgi:hypothetical protein
MSVQIWGYADSTTVLEAKQRYIEWKYDELEIAVEHVGLTINEKKIKVMIQIIWGRQNENSQLWGTTNLKCRQHLHLWAAV